MDASSTHIGETRYFYCPTIVSGRYVALSLDRPEQLSFCEVEIYSKHGITNKQLHLYIHGPCKLIYSQDANLVLNFH